MRIILICLLQISAHFLTKGMKAIGTRASYSELACTSPVPSEAASYGLDDSEEEVYNSDQIGVLILEKWNATAEYEILLEPAAYSRRSYAGPHSL